MVSAILTAPFSFLALMTNWALAQSSWLVHSLGMWAAVFIQAWISWVGLRDRAKRNNSTMAGELKRLGIRILVIILVPSAILVAWLASRP